MKQFTDLEKLSMFDSIYEKWNCETKSAIEFMKERDELQTQLDREKLITRFGDEVQSLNLALIKELNQYKPYTKTPLSQEYKTILENIKEKSMPTSEWRQEIPWLINRVEQGVFYHAHAEYQISILNKVKEFTKNEYLEGVESTTDFRGGYAAALKDLKRILE